MNKLIIKKYFFFVLVFGFFFLFINPKGIYAFDEKCTINGYTYNIDNAKGGEKYKVYAMVLGSDYNFSFDVTGTLERPQNGSLGSVNLTDVSNTIPKDFTRVVFSLYYKHNDKTWKKSGSKECEVTFYKDDIPTGDFEFAPKVSNPSRCKVRIAEGTSNINFDIRIERKSDGVKEKLWTNIRGLENSIKEYIVVDYSTFGYVEGKQEYEYCTKRSGSGALAAWVDCGSFSYECYHDPANPIIPGDGDGDGGSSDIPTLTCEEICSGEEKESDNYNYCISCICEGEPSGTVTTGNVWTELGCIDATQNGIIISVMRIFVGVVTGLAIIRFIQAGFMLNTDDPEKIKEGKSIAVSAVAAIAFGALLIVIMNFIGINVLGIGKIVS
jgi:hypothetical protein